MPPLSKEDRASAEASFEAEQLRQAQEEKADADYLSFLDEAKQKAQQIRERLHPDVKFGHEIMDLKDLSDVGALSANEFGDALVDVAKRFHDAMDRDNPFLKMQKDAAHLLDAAKTPAEKLEDQLSNVAKLFRAGALNEAEAKKLTEQDKEGFLRSMGVGEKEDRFHAPTHIEGPQAITDQGQAYNAFFKGLQPSVNSEAAKHTTLLEKLVELQNRANDIEQKIASTITAPPQVASI